MAAREKVEFHERVREAYLKIAASNPDRIRVIDASGSAQETHESVMDIVMPFLEARGITEQRAKSTALRRTN